MPDLRDASEVLGLLRSSSGTRKKDGSIRCKMPGTSTEVSSTHAMVTNSSRHKSMSAVAASSADHETPSAAPIDTKACEPTSSTPARKRPARANASTTRKCCPRWRGPPEAM